MIEYDKVDIPMGKSRIGGPVVDLPRGIEYPNDMYFAAQLSLEDITDYDDSRLLPTKGYIYVFMDDNFTGKAIYSSATKDELVRVVKEHEKSFYLGQLIKGYKKEKESISDRYDSEWDEPESASVMGWDAFYGFEISKIFGMYDECQMSDEELIDIIISEKVVLLQIGENFTGEGILNVLIDKNDLKNRDFSRCEIEWSQS